MPRRSLLVDERVGATRQRGREWRERLEDLLRRSDPGDLVEVDLTQVEAMSVSFADEFIGMFMATRLSGDFADRALVLVGRSEDVRETLEVVLQRRDAAALYRDARRKRVEPLAGRSWFRESVELANRLGTFSANDFATHLKRSPQAMNNRLRQMAASGAVLRERVIPEGGGKEFTYRAATAVH